MDTLPPTRIDAEDLMHFAADVADKARRLSLAGFRQRLDVKLKEDHSPVTRVDREVETLLRESIRQRWPDHGIFGEEHGKNNVGARCVWTLDPIDGTRSFISGWPLWGTLIAFSCDDTPVFGLVDMPVLGERWMGMKGRGAWLNGHACRSSGCTALGQATLYATSPDIFQGAERDAFERVSAAVAGRRFGGDCYSYALLASGHVDLVVEADLKPYDYLALVPVIEAAGGVISDWQGNALGLGSGGRVVAAASPELHRQALDLLSEVG